MDQFHPFKDLPQKERIDIYISLIVLSLFGGFIYMLINRATDSAPELDTVSLLIGEVVEDDYDYIKIEEDIYHPVEDEDLKSLSPDRVVPIPTIPLKGVKSKHESIARGENRNIKEDRVAPVAVHLDTAQAIIAERVDEDTIVVNTFTDEEKNVNRDADSQAATNPVLTEAEKTDVEVNKCVIILGAFGRQSNVDKLMNRLRADGVDGFTVPYKSLTRVGVRVPCSESTRMLSKVKSLYTADAVLLKN